MKYNFLFFLFLNFCVMQASVSASASASAQTLDNSETIPQLNKKMEDLAKHMRPGSSSVEECKESYLEEILPGLFSKSFGVGVDKGNFFEGQTIFGVEKTMTRLNIEGEIHEIQSQTRFTKIQIFSYSMQDGKIVIDKDQLDLIQASETLYDYKTIMHVNSDARVTQVLERFAGSPETTITYTPPLPLCEVGTTSHVLEYTFQSERTKNKILQKVKLMNGFWELETYTHEMHEPQENAKLAVWQSSSHLQNSFIQDVRITSEVNDYVVFYDEY